MKIVFPYLGHLHQVLHSLPIAAEIARRHPEVQVEVAASTRAHLEWARVQAAQHAPDAPLKFHLLKTGWFDRLRLALGLGTVPWKQYTLLRNRSYFAAAAAVVTPERTSLFLRRLGLGGTRLVWTRHGAGDRQIGFASDVNKFDYVLMAGGKIERRLLNDRLVRPGHYLTGIYAKFDWALAGARSTPKLFDNNRPTVVYNPHFRGALSSWPAMGEAVLCAFAHSHRYNLIFAPHIRLFDAATPMQKRAFERYARMPNIHVDLGSERSVDMSYTLAADVYLGDVSSQVAEFVLRPRPCVFINAHGVSWQQDPNYACWALGEVVTDVQDIEHCIDRAIATHADYAPAQQRYLAETFGIEPGTLTSARGADAIVEFLKRPQRAPLKVTGVVAPGYR